jgi:hypothetical protein
MLIQNQDISPLITFPKTAAQRTRIEQAIQHSFLFVNLDAEQRAYSSVQREAV